MHMSSCDSMDGPVRVGVDESRLGVDAERERMSIYILYIYKTKTIFYMFQIYLGIPAILAILAKRATFSCRNPFRLIPLRNSNAASIPRETPSEKKKEDKSSSLCSRGFFFLAIETVSPTADISMGLKL